RTVPVVFVEVAEPVGAGFVETLARPGGNATGFMLFEYGIGAKWLELLKEVAQAFLQTPAVAAGPGQFGAMQALTPSLRVQVRRLDVRARGAIKHALTDLARPENGGLIVPAAAAQQVPRDVIIKLAAQHRLPAVYSGRDCITLGGLMSFGPDRVDQYRRAAA